MATKSAKNLGSWRAAMNPKKGWVAIRWSAGAANLPTNKNQATTAQGSSMAKEHCPVPTSP